MTTEGTTRAEAAAHILARETGRRMRAVQTRIDEVEEQRKIALDAITSRLVDHDQADERQSGLIDGLRSDLGTAREITAALDVAHGETRELTAAQAQELVSIAERLAANEQIDSAQDAELTGLTGRIEGLELRAPVPGPPGPKGPAGPSGRVAYGGGGGSATIQSAGTLVANRPILNFVSGATVADDSTNNRVNITVSGGGGGTINSVSVSSGLSITGTSDLTITNTGVRSLSALGLTVSDSTGAVTITAPTVTGGTGITVAGSGTTALTVSATGVQSLTAGNGITVSGTTTPTVSASLAAGTGIGISGTTTLSVSNTGVTSLAGTGISVSASTGAVTITAPVVAGGTGITVAGSQTTSLSISNTGVTSIVAGTNVSVSGATGAVTVNAPAYGTTITASTIGGTAAAGTSTGVAREDHKHAFPAGATAGASAVGDTAATGTATTVALSDHRHSREAFGTPVVVDGQTTTLATGSLTTLARADHVHTVTNAWVRIGLVTTASSATSIAFSSIPQSYKFLRLLLYARTQSVYSLTAGVLRFNGDTGSNYYSGDLGTASQTYIRGALFSGPATYDANIASISDVLIAGYSSTLYTKPVYAHWGAQNNTTSTASFAYASFYAIWRSTAAISSVTITMDSAEAFANGTTAVLMAC